MVLNGSIQKLRRTNDMHVHNTLYIKLDSDYVNHKLTFADSESVTSIVVEVPEGINITSTFGNYALDIPKLPNIAFIKIIVDGTIIGEGGNNWGGGIINRNPTCYALCTSNTGQGIVRGGGGTSGYIRYALAGKFNALKNPPRLFNF